jgi:epoxyqueuosine reductase
VNASQKTAWILPQARALGFELCGVTRAEELPELARLPEWLERGYAGEMAYLHDPRRRAPAQALAGARSVIVCALNYNTAAAYSTEAVVAGSSAARGPQGWISRYAWGDDYHRVLGARLEALVAALRAQFPEPFEARAYVDTDPVVERVAAKYAGLGWLAKNTCLINERMGSWLFLGVVLTTLELAPSLPPDEAPPPDLCGNCRLCLDACPTGALVEPYLLDARRCISYLTIELRGSIPTEFRPAMGWMVFGCDICQDVCPWNRKAATTGLAAFQPRTVSPSVYSAQERSLLMPELEWLAPLSEEEFRRVFRSSAVKRAKWRGLVRNACVALGNCAAGLDPAVAARVTALLERLARSGDALIAEHACWALDRLRAVPQPGRPPAQAAAQGER